MSESMPFDHDELARAVEEWHCSCGPAAIAFLCECSLETIRYAVRLENYQGWMNPSMVNNVLGRLNRSFDLIRLYSGKLEPSDISEMFQERPALVRVQWGGPWIANARWSYIHTHYIVSFGEQEVFDINFGVCTFDIWRQVYVPRLTSRDRRDGTWHPTHIWRLK